MLKLTNNISEGLAFDDVLVIPSYSEVLPSEVDTSVNFSKNIKLNIPIVSSAMDTVSESSMAISLAREGGISVLHKNLSIDEQVRQVKIVKRAESGMILNPVTIFDDSLVEDAKNLMNKYKIGGIPVLSSEKKLVGIVTNRDLRFEKNNKKSIKSVMTSSSLITSTKNISLSEAETILQKNKIEKLPIVNSNNELIGLITFRDISKVKKQPNACKDNYGRLRVAAAIGVGDKGLARCSALANAGVDAVVIDTAHAHSKLVIETLKEVKKNFKNIDCIVGNIATPEAARLLIKNNADGVKIGIGPGSICTTRVVSGVGVPQLTAISNIFSNLKKNKIPLIADGGIRFSGDIVKAIVAGANTVMLGSMLAGLEESPGQTIIFEGRKFKSYRGMGSIEAMSAGSSDRYFQDHKSDVTKLVPEGIVGRVPYKGKLSELIFQYIGGLKAGMGYCGAKKISDLKKAKFIKISSAGMRESHPHNVTITREAPNYSR
ncbi:MAG: IMP dehydrogenase [Flavobacteriales bacterium]|nr:IMP dehydrogenase [Flavobacteriales bacterium]